MPLPDTASPEDPVAAAASSAFGIRYLFPYQRLVVSNILDATAPAQGPGVPPEAPAGPESDGAAPDRLRQIVLLPTGYGKSLCFQLPAVLIRGLTLAIFPLRSLVRDQARRLGALGIPCAVLQGGMEGAERARVFDDIRTGRVRIVLANPEILRTEPVLALIRSVGVAHAVVDEAHCVAEWGDGFRPAYNGLGVVVRSLDAAAVTAFTATASPGILARTAEVLFGDDPWRTIAGDPDRPGLRYACVPTLSKPHTLARLAEALPKPLLIFCASRAGAQIAAEELGRRLGAKRVRFYHAGMTAEERGAVERWFLPSRDGILAATCAFGLGIDKPDIRTVLHADPPPSVESYLQESGRAGRDGKPSWAVLISHPSDRMRIGFEQDPTRRIRRRAVLDYAENSRTCRRESLLSLLGARCEACSGCDVCRGEAASTPEGKAGILRFAAANSGRYTIPEAARRLAGLSGPCAEGGTLAGWDPSHVAEAMSFLAVRGEIRVRKRGPWAGRVRRAGGKGRVRRGATLRPAPPETPPQPLQPGAGSPGEPPA